MPGDIVDKNSIHQFIEFPILQDDEFDEFMSDRTGWILKKAMPRTTGLLEPVANWNIAGNTLFGGHMEMAAAVSAPESRQMIETLWKISDMNAHLQECARQFDIDIEGKGYPVLMQGWAQVPYDNFSDMYRGTLNGMMDMMERPDIVLEYCRKDLKARKP
jgi:hypothetical protein